jgi:predicted O-methyltransferase YrrM
MSIEPMPNLSPRPGSPRDRDNRYYHILAGGARTRLLEGFLDLGIPELLGATGPMTARAICEKLGLDLHRGWKFLHLLAMNGLLLETNGELGDDDAVFELSTASMDYFGPDGTGGYFYRDLVAFWRAVAELPLVDVLRGMHLPDPVYWPPRTPEAAEHLETWMRVTAQGAIQTIVRSGAMFGAKSLLDVGGGDGTIGCALANEYPGLSVTVFNLPASAAIGRRTISAKGCAERVRVHEGDFLADELPSGFDRVMYSRVLTDWTPEVCQQLLAKARRALNPGGRVVINEALVEGNEDYALSWEFRYLYYDTFGRAMFKPLGVYRHLLESVGLRLVRVTPMIDEAFYSVLEAEAQ